MTRDTEAVSLERLAGVPISEDIVKRVVEPNGACTRRNPSTPQCTSRPIGAVIHAIMQRACNGFAGSCSNIDPPNPSSKSCGDLGNMAGFGQR